MEVEKIKEPAPLTAPKDALSNPLEVGSYVLIDETCIGRITEIIEPGLIQKTPGRIHVTVDIDVLFAPGASIRKFYTVNIPEHLKNRNAQGQNNGESN